MCAWRKTHQVLTWLYVLSSRSDSVLLCWQVRPANLPPVLPVNTISSSVYLLNDFSSVQLSKLVVSCLSDTLCQRHFIPRCWHYLSDVTKTLLPRPRHQTPRQDTKWKSYYLHDQEIGIKKTYGRPISPKFETGKKSKTVRLYVVYISSIKQWARYWQLKYWTSFFDFTSLKA